MRVNTFIDWVKVHPLYAGLGAIVLVFLLFAASNGIGRAVEAYKDRKFDNEQAAHEKDVTDLKVSLAAAIKRGDDAESKALLKEAESKELRDLIAAKGGTIQKAADELEKKIEQAKQGAGDCASSADPAGCTCTKLKALGFECN